MNLGLSGNLARATIRSPLTPLFLAAAVVFGVIALMVIPREEEPQISVPMVDIMVRADGLKAPDAAELVTKPLEAIVKGINGVEHVYSQTQDDRVMVTARFLTGTSEDDAILRVHAKLRASYDRIPLGIPEPLIIGRGINDVAVLTLTLSPRKGGRWRHNDLRTLAAKVQAELMKVDDVGLTYIVGGSADEIGVVPDPEKLALFGVTLQQLEAKIQGANRSFLAGGLRKDGRMAQAVAGHTLAGEPDIGLLLVTTRDGRPVYVRDLAAVTVGAAPAEHGVWSITRSEDAGSPQNWDTAPAVTIAFAKRAGANAVVVSGQLVRRLETLKGALIPDGVGVEITRDYGRTANDKANELLFHLALATVSIVLLVGFIIGWREAGVTLIVIPTTILLTMFAANLMGYTINRVSLFALIFSIGILVDDAIVVVENIARHWAMADGRDRLRAAVEAVAEVGNPTIVATLTVVVALLPMLFVSGMMGPYMAPIPANASAAMLFSFFVAMVIAPWALYKLSRKAPGGSHGHGAEMLEKLYLRAAGPVLKSKTSARKFLAIVAAATVAVCFLFVTKTVTVKLLPFDNKSELAVMVDLAEGATAEDTGRALFAAAEAAKALPEVRSIQAYAGTPAPFNFNGLVRHYYLREQPELGELQLNLADKGERSRQSHDIALDLRQRLARVPFPAGAVIKVVEVPPGPPVLATLLAEVYAADSVTRRAVATELQGLFRAVPYVVDVDNSWGAARPRLRISIDQDKLEFFGVEQSDVYDTLKALLGGLPVGYSHRGEDRDPIQIVVREPKSELNWSEKLASTPVPANAQPGNRAVVELGDVVRIEEEAGSPVIFRRDGHYADLVTAELAGDYEAPIYGMMAVDDLIKGHDWKGPTPAILLHGQPEDESRPAVLWDGEWEVTYVTFRDMGAAFMVAILGIYVLVVAQFRSFRIPLVILTPIPLTLIGIVVGHILFGAPFTATSMIGFIALAGIIVRNSILLVDFIRHGAHDESKNLRQILLDAGATRFRPILLTALAAMIGAATILTDPIFQGLAISLLFGLASSTLLTVLVIPAIYVWLKDADRAPAATPS